MIERYYEQQVTRTPENLPKKRILAMRILKWSAIVALVITGSLYLGVTPWGLIPQMAVGEAVFYVLYHAAIVAAEIGTWIFAVKYRAKLGEEFDYVLNGRKFRIVRVINFSSRRLFMEFGVDHIEQMGKIGLPSYERISADGRRSLKKKFALVDYKNEDVIYFAVINDGGEKILLHFVPDENLLRELRMTLGRDIVEREQTTLKPKKL